MWLFVAFMFCLVVGELVDSLCVGVLVWVGILLVVMFFFVSLVFWLGVMLISF